MKKHFAELSSWLVEKGYSLETKIIEIGSNDGTLLQQLIEIGFNPIGVDPAENIVEYSLRQGHKVMAGHFSDEFVSANELHNIFDLAISCNSFAHINSIRKVARGIYMCLKDKGSFLVEVQSWEELVRLRAFDFVYHEHKYYYDKDSMMYLLALEGFELESADLVPIHGGSWRFLFRKTKSIPNANGFPLRNQLAHKKDNIEESIKDFFQHLKVLEEEIKSVVAAGGKVIGFGASGRANMLINYMDLEGLIDTVFDESPERIGRNIGFSGIKIKPFSSLQEDEYTHCVVLAWNFMDAVVEKWPHRGKKLICPLPVLSIFSS